MDLFEQIVEIIDVSRIENNGFIMFRGWKISKCTEPWELHYGNKYQASDESETVHTGKTVEQVKEQILIQLKEL